MRPGALEETVTVGSTFNRWLSPTDLEDVDG